MQLNLQCTLLDIFYLFKYLKSTAQFKVWSSSEIPTFWGLRTIKNWQSTLEISKKLNFTPQQLFPNFTWLLKLWKTIVLKMLIKIDFGEHLCLEEGWEPLLQLKEKYYNTGIYIKFPSLPERAISFKVVHQSRANFGQNCGLWVR